MQIKHENHFIISNGGRFEKPIEKQISKTVKESVYNRWFRIEPNGSNSGAYINATVMEEFTIYDTKNRMFFTATRQVDSRQFYLNIKDKYVESDIITAISRGELIGEYAQNQMFRIFMSNGGLDLVKEYMPEEEYLYYKEMYGKKTSNKKGKKS